MANRSSAQERRDYIIVLRRIVDLVSTELSVHPEDILSHSRKRNLVEARLVVIYCARTFVGCSWHLIGHYLGNRRHSSILRAFRRYNQLVLVDRDFGRVMNVLQDKLGDLSPLADRS